jgi:crotonobetainyl-CoA:carnitine CoA-transferase CaiB-like acyl-CoA transferase
MGEGPLSDLRVVEVANWLAAPGAAAMMADMGAEAVKVEPPSGDFYRGYLMSQRGDGEVNYNFELENRGKRSVTVDLGRPGGAEVVLRLCERADVFVTNLVRERFERYGLGFEAVRAASPRIVYAAVTGYGTRGPEANKPGFDASAFWAASGIMGVMGEADANPVHSRGGQGDHPTAMTALAAILAALRLRDRTGDAQFVDVSLVRSGVWTLAADVQQVLAGLGDRPRQDRTRQGMITWNSYRTSDGRWLMLVMNDPPRYWDRFARCMGREEWVGDPRYTTTPELLVHGPALIPELDELFAEHDLAYWSGRLDEFGCLWALARSVSEVIADPQLREAGAFARVERSDGTSYETVAVPFEIAGAEVWPRGAAPAVGADTAAVLSEAGFTSEEVAELGAGGVFG